MTMPTSPRPVRVALVLTTAAISALLASSTLGGCSESSVPGGQGNDVIDDTRPEPRPPANPDPPMDAETTDASDAALYADGPPQVTCGGCACTPDTHFCFSGGTVRGLDTTPPKSPADDSADASDGGDSGPPACPLPPDASTIQAGCNDIPSACAASPTCDCLLTALQPMYACYLVCRVPGPQFLVYCPNP